MLHETLSQNDYKFKKKKVEEERKVRDVKKRGGIGGYWRGVCKSLGTVILTLVEFSCTSCFFLTNGIMEKKDYPLSLLWLSILLNDLLLLMISPSPTLLILPRSLHPIKACPFNLHN